MTERLYDGDGFLWDFYSDGGVINGIRDAFDGGFRWDDYRPDDIVLSENGREVNFSASEVYNAVEGLLGSRSIYVSDTLGYIRYLDTLTNTTSESITYTYELRTNLGSDGGTQIVATSSGDASFTNDDTYLSTDDYSLTSGDPTVTHIIGDGTTLPDSTSISRDYVRVTFTLTIEPGETVSLLFFGFQNDTPADAAAQISDYENNFTNYLEGLSASELAQVVNFATDLVDGTANDDQLAPGFIDADGDEIDGADGVDDVIYAYDGDDTVFGGLGDDTIDGGAGNDNLSGDGGNDELFGNDGDDILHGGLGDDALRGGTGADTLNGLSGVDTLHGDDGNDTLHGGPGNDTLDGGEGDDIINGGFDDDFILGRNGNDVIAGSGGNDNINAGNGDDIVTAGMGADRVVDGAGTDSYHLESGDDTFRVIDAILGDDVADGGAGYDTLDLSDFASFANVFVDLEAGTLRYSTGASDIVTSFEALIHTDTGGRIDGSAEANIITAAGGNDTVFAGAGDDVITGDAGNDRLYGQDGADMIDGGIGDDRILGDQGDDNLIGSDGNDSLIGGTGMDTLEGGNGDDRLVGDDGNDLLLGGNGNDRLIGGNGEDRYDGGLGNDILVDSGLDMATDTFVFMDGTGDDQILNYDQGDSILELDSALWGGGLTAQQVINQYVFINSSGTRVFFNFGDDSITLINGDGFDLSTLVEDLLII